MVWCTHFAAVSSSFSVMISSTPAVDSRHVYICMYIHVYMYMYMYMYSICTCSCSKALEFRSNISKLTWNYTCISVHVQYVHNYMHECNITLHAHVHIRMYYMMHMHYILYTCMREQYYSQVHVYVHVHIYIYI